MAGRVALLLVAFASGAAFGYFAHAAWPVIPTPPENALYTSDGDGRLVAVAGRRAVPCPAPAPGTVVLLVLGQSNAANALGERYRSRHPGQVLSYHAGRCHEAESPLIGASGAGGEFWTEVGNRLVERGARRVVLMPMAITATPIALWRADGHFGGQVLAALRAAPYRPTAIAWLQGESDVMLETRAADYRADFHSLLSALRRAGISAPVHVGIASFCADGTRPGWTPDNPVATAQRALPDGHGILPGPDTDRAVPLADRMDGCHFSGRGSATAAALWADALQPDDVAWDHVHQAKSPRGV